MPRRDGLSLQLVVEDVAEGALVLLGAPSRQSEDELVARAKASPRVQGQLDGKEIRHAIVVPRKLVNLVV